MACYGRYRNTGTYILKGSEEAMGWCRLDRGAPEPPPSPEDLLPSPAGRGLPPWRHAREDPDQTFERLLIFADLLLTLALALRLYSLLNLSALAEGQPV